MKPKFIQKLPRKLENNINELYILQNNVNWKVYCQCRAFIKFMRTVMQNVNNCFSYIS